MTSFVPSTPSPLSLPFGPPDPAAQSFCPARRVRLPAAAASRPAGPRVRVRASASASASAPAPDKGNAAKVVTYDYPTAVASPVYALDPPRLEAPSARTRDSAFSEAFLARLHVGKYRTSVGGLLMLKDALALHLFSALLESKRPGTVIDLGTAGGGSALWFAREARSLGLHDTEVVSFDIDDMRSDDGRAAFDREENLTFCLGNMFKADEALRDARDKHGLKLRHPWIIAEDCHVEAQKLLDGFFKGGLTTGDYIVFEDTHPCGPDQMYMDADNPNLTYTSGQHGLNKLRQVEHAIKVHGGDDRFAVDATVQDMYGYNGATFINSVLTIL